MSCLKKICNKKSVFVVFIILVIITVLGFKNCINEGINAASISGDGKYVITTGPTKAIFWDIKNKSYKVIGNNANYLSAHFVKGTEYFLWQDKNNIVHIRNLSGIEVKKFELPDQVESGFLTKDLSRYVYSNHVWQIKCYDLNKKTLEDLEERDSYRGHMSQRRLHLSGNQKYFISAGDGYHGSNGLLLWDTETMKPIKVLKGNGGKLSADINYDGTEVTSMGESMGMHTFNLVTGEIEHDYFFRISKAFYTKYITKEKSIAFSNEHDFEFPKVIRKDYRLNQTTDVAPEVSMIVQAKLRGNGIVISRFNKEAGHGFEKIWSSGGMLGWWIDLLAEINWNVREFIDTVLFLIYYIGWKGTLILLFPFIVLIVVTVDMVRRVDAKRAQYDKSRS